jgi:hypothetical protein
VNGDLLYKLCAVLTAKGLGTPEIWQKSDRGAAAFARNSISAAIGKNRGDLIRRNVEYTLQVSDVFTDGYSYGSDPRVGDGKLVVSITCTGAGYLRIGPALDALECEAEGLGAAFYWSLVHAIYRVMRIYDHDDAMMYEEMLRESASQDDESNRSQYEFPEVQKALPPYIRETPSQKWQISDRRLLKTHVNGACGTWIKRLRTLQKLSRLNVESSRELVEGNYDGPPLPSLILAFRDHDAIVACFDEESQHMLESSSEPALCVVFSLNNSGESDRAMRTVERFIAFNAELYLLAEELVAWEESHGCRDSDRREPSIRAA